ncbi:UDP-glucuronosyltransferase 2B14-like 3 [Homarus americanus]|uniref:UDP-glucuronosyltransferase 2B14-like 3 n=1 Tax=Homarus americanus TaxID=6706 RepID=A0A8J5TL13_HOMAM|nr:UDP-glucuronosyltransferase 2B14-like 3 [Homarus americanus]
MFTGHKNLRLFVTHCGIHSASEAVYHGVPVLGLPITFEQPRKCARIARRGEGLVLQWEQLTPEAIIDSVYTLVHDVSLVQYLLLDVLAIIGGVALVIGVVLFFLARSIFKRFWPSSSSKAKLE